ncbi:MAG: hypothetical protein ABWZ08_09125, partial [Pseudoxanthomonas sp.]
GRAIMGIAALNPSYRACSCHFPVMQVLHTVHTRLSSGQSLSLRATVRRIWERTMGNNHQPEGKRSKFTPTGNEQGSEAVQPHGHKDSGEAEATARERLEKEEQRVTEQTHQADDDKPDQDSGNLGLFSALVGDGKEPL